MTMHIVNDHPFTNQEISWLESRGRFDEVRENRRLFPVVQEPKEETRVVRSEHIARSQPIEERHTVKKKRRILTDE